MTDTWRPIYKVVHTGHDAKGEALTPVNLTDIIMLRTEHGIDKKSGSFNLKLNNVKLASGDMKYTATFKSGDYIDVYMGYGTNPNALSTGDLVMKGEIMEWGADVTDRGRLLSIKGIDLNKKLMDFVYVWTYNSGKIPSDWTSGEENEATNLANSVYSSSMIVKDIIGWASRYLPSDRQINTDSVSFVNHYAGYVAINYEPIYDVISKMATVEYTKEEQNYIFWVDNNHVLQWKPRPDSTFDPAVKETEDFFSLKADKSIYDIKNALIINCGEDYSGNAIYAEYHDHESVAESGFLWDYWAQTNIAKKIIKETEEDYDALPTPFDMEAGNWYNPTTKEIEKKIETINNLTEYNAAIRAEAKCDAEEAGKGRVDELKLPRWKADVRMAGNLNYTFGNLIYIESETLGWTDVIKEGTTEYTGQKLRVKSITQEFSERGWFTVLHTKEDESEFKKE